MAANDNDFGIVCPACDNPNILPVLPDGECQDPPVQSEICSLYFGGTELPTDWTTPAGWTGVIDNTDTSGEKTKCLVGRGSKSEPEETNVEGAKNQDFTIEETTTIEFEVLNPHNQEVFAFLQQLKCNKYRGRIWFETLGCCLVGGERGIPVSSVKVSFPYESGRESYKKAIVRVTYKCTQEPPLIENPLA